MHQTSALNLPEALDVLGIFTSAAAGALTGLRKGLDLIGVLVLSAVTAFGGGVIRDLMIGAVPPAVLTDPWYLSTALVATVVVVALDRRFVPVHEGLRSRLPLADAFLLADAATLGCFAVVGALKALDYGLAAVPAALMGVVTAVGGGIMRDVLVNEVPLVLRREMYAVPALIGAAIVVLAAKYEPAVTPLAYLAAFITATMRMIAVRRDWHMLVPEQRQTRKKE